MEMTPKEKSKEIIEEMFKSSGTIHLVECVRCALIAVNEILKTFNTNWQWCSISMEDKALWSKEFEFWKQVKEEIISYGNKL